MTILFKTVKVMDIDKADDMLSEALNKTIDKVHKLKQIVTSVTALGYSCDMFGNLVVTLKFEIDHPK